LTVKQPADSVSFTQGDGFTFCGARKLMLFDLSKEQFVNLENSNIKYN